MRIRVVAYESEESLKNDFEDPGEAYSVGGACGCCLFFDTWREATEFINIVIRHGGYALTSAVDRCCKKTVEAEPEVTENK